MGGEISTIQSLKAVDAWIDVINANINGGVRTAFKASRLKFSGSNVDIQQAGNSTSLPLQFPEPGLQTANTVIDFTQGAITASTENTHLAIQGDGFFLVIDPGSVNADGTLKQPTASTRLYLTRDGEFRTNQNGCLVTSAGYYLITIAQQGTNDLYYDNVGLFGTATSMRCVYNNLDTSAVATVATLAVNLSDYLPNKVLSGPSLILADGVTPMTAGLGVAMVANVPVGKQSLKYSSLGSTVFDPSYDYTTGKCDPNLIVTYSGANGTTPSTVLSKSLEASNSSMTQSVPELSLAQKLFSALTKVLQTKQTNLDGVLNLVR